MGFKIKASDGAPIEIQDGDYYFNTKARGRRMMANSLSSDARRVYACLELATMGWKQELAVTMDGGERRPLTPTDIRNQTGLSRQHVRRGLEDLEEAGLVLRKAPDGGALRKGQVLIYSWAVPREPKEKDCSRARLQFPDWFPESWAGLTPLINRFKYRDFPDKETARGYFQEGEEIARGYQKAEIVAIAFLDRVCAGAPHKGRKNVKNLERTSAAAAGVSTTSAAADSLPPTTQPVIPIAEHVAQELSIDDDAAQRLVAGCQEVEKTITGPEIVGLARAKIHAARDQIRTGKITNATGLLIKHLPKMCVGASLQAVREQLEAENKDRALRISYAREAWDDLNEDERQLALRRYPELGDERGTGEPKEAHSR